MDWSKGFTASYYAYIVDPKTWRDIQLLKLVDGSIARSGTGLRNSADITCTDYNGAERYIRIYLDTQQNGRSAHVALFTGLASSPSKDINGTVESSSIECYSVLKPAEDVLLDRGFYIPAGMNGGVALKQLLKVTPAPLEVIGEPPALQTAIIAEDGENHLTMADKVLTAINWRMRILGDGTIQVLPMASSAAKTFDPIKVDVVEPVLKVTKDWYECPNVFRAVADDIYSVARDDSPDSPLSTVNRGREVWEEETGVSLNTGESIAEYATRRLKELQQVETTASYTRRYDPDVLVGDIVRMNYPKQHMQGLFKITSQRITLGHGCATEEEAEYVNQ